MRDRLIELLKSARKKSAEIFAEETKKWLQIGEIPKHKQTIDEIEADYLLENGVIVPPMNIGQQCFILGYDFGERKECVKQCRVSCVTQKKNGSFAIRISETKYSATHNFTPDDIGKTVFLNKEEAEAKLKGGEG